MKYTIDEYTDEEEIFRMYAKEVLQETEIDPLEYIALRDTIGFQCYMFRKRWDKLVESIIESLGITRLIDWLEKKL